MDLLNDALILSKRLNFDVFNALDVLENDAFLKELKFGIGDGHLQYYLYNWRCAPPLAPAPPPLDPHTSAPGDRPHHLEPHRCLHLVFPSRCAPIKPGEVGLVLL